MRPGLGAPAFELPAENVDAIRAFLDGQSRIRLAVWVRHDEGGAPDHHLVLGIDDEDWRAGDMRALEEGMQLPGLATSEPTWIDLFPVSEVETIRSFATVLWEQGSPGADPLDYRFTREPFTPDAVALHSFTARVASDRAIRSVGATVQLLWKADELVDESVQLVVDTLDLTSAMDAARETILADRRAFGATTGRPEAGTILYEAVRR